MHAAQFFERSPHQFFRITSLYDRHLGQSRIKRYSMPALQIDGQLWFGAPALFPQPESEARGSGSDSSQAEQFDQRFTTVEYAVLSQRHIALSSLLLRN
jgi:hypothetical protein